MSKKTRKTQDEAGADGADGAEAGDNIDPQEDAELKDALDDEAKRNVPAASSPPVGLPVTYHRHSAGLIKTGVKLTREVPTEEGSAPKLEEYDEEVEGPHPHPSHVTGEPLAATVVKVWGPDVVNLRILDEPRDFARTSVERGTGPGQWSVLGDE